MLFTLQLQKLAVFHIRPAYLQQYSCQQLPTHRLHRRWSRSKTAHVCPLLKYPRITIQNTNIEVLIERRVEQDMKFPLGVEKLTFSSVDNNKFHKRCQHQHAIQHHSLRNSTCFVNTTMEKFQHTCCDFWHCTNNHYFPSATLNRCLPKSTPTRHCFATNCTTNKFSHPKTNFLHINSKSSCFFFAFVVLYVGIWV